MLMLKGCDVVLLAKAVPKWVVTDVGRHMDMGCGEDDPELAPHAASSPLLQ